MGFERKNNSFLPHSLGSLKFIYILFLASLIVGVLILKPIHLFVLKLYISLSELNLFFVAGSPAACFIVSYLFWLNLDYQSRPKSYLEHTFRFLCQRENTFWEFLVVATFVTGVGFWVFFLIFVGTTRQ